VSTKDQGENGYGLEAQAHQLETYCAANDLNLIAVIPDVMSGRKTDKLYGRIAAVAAIRAGLANVLVINALDRVSRNTLDGLSLVKDAQAEGWRVLSLDGVDSDKVEKLWLTVRMGFAEEERDKISKRTKQGLIKARQAGKQLGRPSQIPRDTVARIVGLRMQERKGANTIARILTEDGVPAPAGSKWYPTTVRGVLSREGVE
jgi:DNA invertase Pin-like site-specific DNA recombinase